LQPLVGCGWRARKSQRGDEDLAIANRAPVQLRGQGTRDLLRFC
jgi:hypothetical protein